jgi:hypothetical protein
LHKIAGEHSIGSSFNVRSRLTGHIAVMEAPMTFQSSDAQVVCGLSGLNAKVYDKKLIELKDLEQGLMVSVQQAEKAIKDERFWKRMLVGAKLTKVACGLALDVMEELADDTPASPAAQAITIIYDRLELVVDGLNGDLNATKIGQHVAETHVDAVAKSLDYMDKKKLSRVVSRAKTLIKTAGELYEVVTDEDPASGLEGARRTALQQLRRIQDQIRRLDQEIESCRETQPMRRP